MQLARRHFLKLTALAAAVTALGADRPREERRGEMPYRELGKTGEMVSLLCVGGAHIGHDTLTDEESITLMRTAVDEGVNFFDNAYVYNNGRSEERMGKALQDGYRDRVFLMTKHYSDARDAESAKKQLEESLTRLQTDHLDLWQVHQILKAEHPKAVYDNGLLDVMTKARDEGKVRFIGFTGHSRPEWHLEMIERGFPWDTVQMPINALDHHWLSFQNTVLPKAREKGMGVIGMKSLGGSPGQIVANAKVLSAEECLHYAMNLPVSTVVSGMDTMEYLQANLAAAKSWQPLSEEQVASILEKAGAVADGGQFEPYKVKSV